MFHFKQVKEVKHMDVFEKAAKAAKEVGDNVFHSAKNIGESIYNLTKDQSELASLNVQKSAIEKRLTDSYAMIGKRYVEYMQVCDGGEVFEVSDILEEIQPELDRLSEVRNQIKEKEDIIKAVNEERAKKKAQDEFDEEKQKLDKALELEIITRLEYEEKLAAAQKKLDCYDLLRKVNMQLEMGIITQLEYEEKVKKILQP